MRASVPPLLRRAAAVPAVSAVAAGGGSSTAATAVKNGVPMEVTLDHSRIRILHTTVPYGSSALADLERVAHAGTAYGGKFVTSIDVHGKDVSISTYWLIYVNCRPAQVGAADITVRRGDRIWWDLRRTSGALPTGPDPACPFPR
ncbi:MAG TPA: DUF4430 domain-containing protein [Gaiellales bacterium]|nr:DUF4430 domain-containing protein [Gaiellales bacterium]